MNSIFKCKQHIMHDNRGPVNYTRHIHMVTFQAGDPIFPKQNNKHVVPYLFVCFGFIKSVSLNFYRILILKCLCWQTCLLQIGYDKY